MPTARTRNKSKDKAEAPNHGPVVTKVGNLTADPELRYSERETAYCRLRIAVAVPVKAGDWAGERKTAFYGVTAFGTLAENAAECLAKGMRIVVTGLGEVRTWTGDDGAERKEKAILAEALGPDLRWATATVAKVTASKGPAGSEATAAGDDEEEPF